MRALVLALSLLVGVSGCGGKKVSTGPSRSTVSFANEYAAGHLRGPWVFVIDIPTAHQHFELAETDRKVIELVSEDGSTEFEFTVTKKGTEDTKTGVVSIGEKVSMGPSFGQDSESWKIFIDGEPMEE